MPITVPQINPTLLQGAAPAGLSNLLPGYLAGTKLAQEREVAQSKVRATEATYQETLKNAANLARKRKRQEAYETAVAGLDVTLPGDRAKLYQIQSQYPDIVTPQTALLPEEPDPPTPETVPEKIKLVQFMHPDDLEKQRELLGGMIEDPETADKVTSAMTNAAAMFPYPGGQTAEQIAVSDPTKKAEIDKQRIEWMKGYLEKGPLVKIEGDDPAKFLKDKWIKDETRIEDDARTALNGLVTSHQMLRILQQGDFRTGAMAGLVLKLKKIGIAMWPSLADTMGEGIPEAEAFKAFGNRLALELKKEMPGPLSDKDVAFMQESSPGLERTLGGNLILLSLLIRRQERAILYGRLATDYAEQSETGYVDRNFNEWVNEHPRWEKYKVITEADGSTTGGLTDGYRAGALIQDILTTIDANDEDATQKLDGLPNYTVYYLERDGKKEIKMKMPGTATPAETVPAPTVQTVQPTTTETGLP